MKELKFTVEEESAGLRVDKYITIKLGAEYSRTYVKFLIDNGFVSVNGKVVKPRHVTLPGDEIRVKLQPPRQDDDIEPESIPLDIVYEDEWFIVVNKPAGMVVHPGAGRRKSTLVNALLYRCGNLPEASDGDVTRPGIVHRLDKDTTGVIVVAKTDRVLRALSGQFQKREVKKRYVAFVKGQVELDNGVVDAPLARSPVDRKKVVVEYSRGRESRTVYHVVRRFKKFTFLSLEPETGRTHQIRVHMKHLGHPIMGDIAYGGSPRMERQALHAEMLGITHPKTDRYMEFTAPMPEDMKTFLAAAEDRGKSKR